MAGEMPSTAAASSSDRPAKNRSFTSSALTGSWAASWVSASSRASRSFRGSTDGKRFVQLDALPVAAVLGPSFPPGVLDEDAAHGFGGGGKEVSPAIPVLHLLHVHEPDVGFVDQGRGLQGLAGRFVGQLLGRQLAQLVVDQGQELTGGVWIAVPDCVQNARALAHELEDSRDARFVPCISG